jgi:virginiamycin B lyase
MTAREELLAPVQRKQIFLSYNRRASLTFVRVLRDFLAAYGYDVWLDVTRIHAGDAWMDVVKREVDASDILLCIVTPGAVASRVVRDEIARASLHGKKVIPVLHRPVNTKKYATMPAALTAINWVDCSTGKDYEAALDDLLRVLGEDGAPPPTVPSNQAVILSRASQAMLRERQAHIRWLWFRYIATPLLIFAILVASILTVPQIQAAIIRYYQPVLTYPLPTATGGPRGIAVGPDGNLWFTEYRSGGRIGRITPAGAITEFLLPYRYADPGPQAITSGPDGKLWFVEAIGNYAHVDRNGHNLTEFAVTETPFDLTDIITGPDDNLWFADSSTNTIQVSDTSGRILHRYVIPGSGLQDLISGPDGQSVWFTLGNSLGRIMLASQTVQTFSLPNPSSDPYGLTVGPDGNVWFCELNRNAIAAMSPTGKFLREVSLPRQDNQPFFITTARHELWFTENTGDRIGRYDPATGHLAEIALNSDNRTPYRIVGGADGNIWFTDELGDNITEIVVRNLPAL